MNLRRDGERGLSIIEAIVVATITALLALLILPLLPRATTGSLRIAERGIDALDQMRAEREFRTLLRAVAQRDVEGEAQTVLEGDAANVVIQPNLAAAVSCASAGAPIVRLRVQNGAMLCESGGRRRVLLRWTSENVGSLRYSADGVAWSANWNGADAAPYVRFELRRQGRIRMLWVERVSGEPI